MSRARFVAAGVLVSRLTGLVRTKVVSHYLGIGAVGDVMTAAFRVPGMLQNLLGEQAMSAAFIPVYSRLLAAGKREEAGRFAGAFFGLLVAVVGGIVLAAVLAAPLLVAVFNPGYLDDARQVVAGQQTFDRYPLAVTAARIIFPMSGLLVLAAWAQGILNSHRRFFLSYVAPVLWNAAIIGALCYYGLSHGIVAATAESDVLGRLVIAATIGALLGGLLQFAVQLPLVLRLSRGLRPALSLRAPHIPETLRALGPALAGRGAVQLSFFIDQVLSSFLHVGAQQALFGGAYFYNLPFAVFATSVAASELPELSSEGAAKPERFVVRLRQSLRQVLFLVLPSTLGYLAFGFLIVGLLKGGRFDSASQTLVSIVLAAYSLGMPASASSRLLQNAFFALGDTLTPARIVGLRVAVSAATGIGLMLILDRFPVSGIGSQPVVGEPLFFGAVGLALGSALGAWVEIILLLRRIEGRLGARLAVPRLALPIGFTAIVTSLPAIGVWWLLRGTSSWLQLAIVPGLYAGCYLGVAALRRSPELARWLGHSA